MEGTVFVISTALDLATDRVVDILSQRAVPLLRFNTEDFPYRKCISWQIDTDKKSCLLDLERKIHSPKDVRSIWYRRVRSPASPPGCDEAIHKYVVNEAYGALRGMTSAHFSGCRWMSFPAKIEAAEMKPYQLYIAAKLGFPIPPTIISSDPLAIRDFFFRHEGNVIAKPVRSGYIEVADKAFAIYTRRLSHKDIELLETALPCPIIVQKEIPKEVDIRVTVVGRKIFSVAIDSQTDPHAKIDWRRTENPDLPHQIHELPGRIKNLLIKLTHELGLSFAAIDLVLTPGGKYFFLEVNPSGQWLWVEDKTGLPISDAVADWLEGV